MTGLNRSIGPYDLLRKIGNGGFGVVYEALDRVTQRRVALKTLSENLSGSDLEKLRTKMVQEFRLLGRLDHPNIVGLLSADFEQDIYYTMPLMSYTLGDTLREAESEGRPLSYAESALVLESIGEALGYAHEQGIVHRDVKPSNVLRGSRDRGWRLADFGIAFMVGQYSNSSILRTGSVRYASPEQCEGKPTGPSSDLYSLATLTFECLTGRLPYEGETDFAVGIAKLQRDPPDPREFRNDLPERVATLLREALARDPEERPANLCALLSALREQEDEILDAVTQPKFPDSPPYVSREDEDATRRARIPVAPVTPEADEDTRRVQLPTMKPSKEAPPRLGSETPETPEALAPKPDRKVPPPMAEATNAKSVAAAGDASAKAPDSQPGSPVILGFLCGFAGLSIFSAGWFGNLRGEAWLLLSALAVVAGNAATFRFAQGRRLRGWTLQWNVPAFGIAVLAIAGLSAYISSFLSATLALTNWIVLGLSLPVGIGIYLLNVGADFRSEASRKLDVRGNVLAFVFGSSLLLVSYAVGFTTYVSRNSDVPLGFALLLLPVDLVALLLSGILKPNQDRRRISLGAIVLCAFVPAFVGGYLGVAASNKVAADLVVGER